VVPAGDVSCVAAITSSRFIASVCSRNVIGLRRSTQTPVCELSCGGNNQRECVKANCLHVYYRGAY
jgi:hypothetical protein